MGQWLNECATNARTPRSHDAVHDVLHVAEVLGKCVVAPVRNRQSRAGARTRTRRAQRRRRQQQQLLDILSKYRRRNHTCGVVQQGKRHLKFLPVTFFTASDSLSRRLRRGRRGMLSAWGGGSRVSRAVDREMPS